MKSTFFSYSLSLVFVGTSIAETINVPDDHALIQDAINASSDGDVINIASGTYNEHSLNPSGKAITIQGTLNEDGSLATTIDALQAGIVFEINSGETYETLIKDLVITGGSSFYGGGIFCDGLSTMSSATIDGCRISDNTGGFGGGLYSVSTHVITISSTVVCGNTSGQIYFDDWIDGGDNCISDDCTNCSESKKCPGDLDGNDSIGFSDVLIVLSDWGCSGNCTSDVDDDDSVGFSDVLTVLSDWGACP